MPSLEQSLDVAASPETVWSILADPAFVPKLYPDIISAIPSQPGMVKIGSVVAITAKINGRKVSTTTEVVELEDNRRLVIKQLPGGVLKKYLSTTTLEPNKKGTKVSQKVEYEASAGYLGKVLSVLVVNRAVRKNIVESLKNLKEISELKELPGSGARS
jgi:carbon monoxide dehydrogenase subunit G